MAETTVETVPRLSKVWPLVGRITLPIVLIWSAVCFIAAPFGVAAAWGGLRHAYWKYDAGLAAISYFDAGFVRRGLEGTLIRPFGLDPMIGAMAFHLVTYSIFAGFSIWLCCREKLPISRQIALGSTLSVILARLALDVGRTDAAIMICGLIAVWAVTEARWIIGAVALFVALLFHEAGMIVLAPLVAGAAYLSGSWRGWASSSGLAASAIIIIALVLYGLSTQANPDAHAIGAHIHKQFQDPLYADLAVFANLSGSRGMADAICTMHHNPAYPIQVISGLIVCPLIAVGLLPSRPLVAVGVSLPAYLGLSLIATDIGRWATFAVFCVFAVATMCAARHPATRIGRKEVGFVLVATFLMFAGLDFRSSGFAPVPLINNFVQTHGLRSLAPAEAITTCDPTWRAALGL